MSALSIRDVRMTLGNVLFQNLNLSVSSGSRVGVVAANGRGKSTFLNLVAGYLEPTSGEITRSRGLTVGYVEQNVSAELMTQPLREAIKAASPDISSDNDWQVDLVFDALQVPNDLHHRPLAHLSGGWQRMALIARVAIKEPDLLLLDEPTNHLDLKKILQVENWLSTLPASTMIFTASHDRAFLDATTNTTLFLRPEHPPIFSLPYSRAKLALEQTDAAAQRRFEKEMRTADQLRRQAAKLKNIGINSGSDLLVTKTKQLQNRAAKIEDLARPGYKDTSAGKIQLKNSSIHSKVLITLNDAVVMTPNGTPLFRTGKMTICRGDRIVLLGSNGAGKTQLVSLLEQAVTKAATNIELGSYAVRATPSLVLGFADQDLSGLDNADTPFSAMRSRFSVDDQRIRTLLAGAGISIHLQQKAIGSLSGGQRARLSMLLLRLIEPNFYLLDEPTNHLDIEGQEELESELLQDSCSCFLVSHDRSFVRRVGNRFWEIRGKRLVQVDDPEAFFKAQAI